MIHAPRRPLRAARAPRGFTLIELLVVLVVVGVMVALASLAVGDNRGEVIQREANRLVALLRLAQDEATLSGQPIGLHVAHDGYTFLAQQDQDTWTPVTGDRSLGPREVPEFVRLDMLVDGEPISPDRSGLSGGDDGSAEPGLSGESGPGLGESGDSGPDQGESGETEDDDPETADDEDDGKTPHTVIYPSGEIYPFQLDVAGQEPGPYYRITGEIHGEIALEKRD